MFKLDDDAFVNVPALVNALKARDVMSNEDKDFILGKAFGLENKPILPIRYDINHIFAVVGRRHGPTGSS